MDIKTQNKIIKTSFKVGSKSESALDSHRYIAKELGFEIQFRVYSEAMNLHVDHYTGKDDYDPDDMVLISL